MDVVYRTNIAEAGTIFPPIDGEGQGGVIPAVGSRFRFAPRPLYANGVKHRSPGLPRSAGTTLGNHINHIPRPSNTRCVPTNIAEAETGTVPPDSSSRAQSAIIAAAKDSLLIPTSPARRPSRTPGHRQRQPRDVSYARGAFPGA